MTALHAEPHPIVRVPQGPWRNWFLNEVAPLNTPTVDHSPEYRRRVTRSSPLRFAITYLDHHLVLQGTSPPLVTFNEMHLALCRAAKNWAQPVRWREAWVAPRGVGKSSWCFLALPLWALAHGHREFFMAFSFNAAMAQRQLANLRMELETNALLRQDYPELAPRPIRGASNTSTTVVANGGTISAAGLGENTLGRKSGSARPDLLVLDDIESMEDAGNPRAKAKLLNAITGAVIPMAAPHAALALFGTTTGYRSAIHDLAQHARGREVVDWVADSGITPRVFPGVLIDPDTGVERSLWPERWPLTDTHLGEAVRRTPDGRVPRSFELNYLLDPSPFGEDAGSFWREELFVHMDGARLGGVLEYAMYVDVAVTTKATSDQTAIVVVGRDPSKRRAVVEYAQAFRISAEELRQRIRRLVEVKPEVRTLIVETNQGGDLWRQMLSPAHDPLPRSLRMFTDHVHVSKRDRAEQALQWYEQGRVVHAVPHVELERQMVLFPSAKVNDDLVDATAGALRWAFGAD